MAVRTAMDDLLEQAVESGQVPGVVALAADETGEIYAGAFGKREAGGVTDMTLDTVFWLASMTKAVTSVAAMQQVERGALDLDAPIGPVLPQLANPQVLDGFDEDGTPRLRPARRPITLRLLLTHTAGFGYDNWDERVRRYAAATGIPAVGTCQLAALNLPLVFDPGERWEYGINIDWAGQAVEAVTGQTLDTYFREQIFQPLSMSDTGFILGDGQRTRKASMHRRTSDTTFDVIPHGLPQQPEFFMGGGGLYSVGRDYLSFLRALLNGGSLNGAQILKPETVAEMGRNQIGELRALPMRTANPASSNDVDIFPDIPKTWGLGYMRTEADVPGGRRAGSLAWAGLANTYYWLDPASGVVGVMLTQILPFADPTVLNLLGRFEQAIYAGRA
ncbi:MAG: serine hydrolase domain-containing protein [Chloroflexota bacterium]